jgi:hypothetical protein
MNSPPNKAASIITTHQTTTRQGRSQATIQQRSTNQKNRKIQTDDVSGARQLLFGDLSGARQLLFGDAGSGLTRSADGFAPILDGRK